VASGRTLELKLKLLSPEPSCFLRGGGFDFSGKEVKTPSLPKTGRVGHPKNLKQKLSVDVLQGDYPVARFHQLKTYGRIGHPPTRPNLNQTCGFVILSEAKNLSFSAQSKRDSSLRSE
jgi:hypothetical protein